uniref:Uncharacterized protein n=1 Tax=Dunaliella tertiolecta TaxID=3047 RepID=A0A7S3VP43_DUNTE
MLRHLLSAEEQASVFPACTCTASADASGAYSIMLSARLCSEHPVEGSGQCACSSETEHAAQLPKPAADAGASAMCSCSSCSLAPGARGLRRGSSGTVYHLHGGQSLNHEATLTCSR